MQGVAKTGLSLLFAAIAACGGAEPSTAEPSPGVAEKVDAAPADPEPAPAPSEDPAPPATGPRVELDAEFHRTRVGPGGGFWVLGSIANPRPAAVVDVHSSVKLLDTEGELLLEVHGQARPLVAGAKAAIVLLVETPVEHEQLELHATGIETDEAQTSVPELKLEHDDPQRADLGGWFVLGQLSNETEVAGGTPVQLEVRAYDAGDRLLGVDWFASVAPAPGESAPFDLGGLRYEEPPKRWEIELVGPAPSTVDVAP